MKNPSKHAGPLAGKSARGNKANLSVGEIDMLEVMARTNPGPPNSPQCRVWAGYISPSGVPVWRIMRPASARRVVYAALVGPLPDGARVASKCTTVGCVAPGCLVLRSRRESALGREVTEQTRLKIRAVLQANAKIKWADVQAIRASAAPQSVLAKLYKVSRTYIGKIKRGEIWRDDAQVAEQVARDAAERAALQARAAAAVAAAPTRGGAPGAPCANRKPRGPMRVPSPQELAARRASYTRALQMAQQMGFRV